MVTSHPRVLFLSHSASRNGATILLLHLLRWLKTQTDWEIAVVVNGRGPLLEEFRSVGPTTVSRSPAVLLNALPKRWKKSLQPRLEASYWGAFQLGRRFDLIYANTAATWPYVNSLAKRAPALLWHIHELGYALRQTIGEGRATQCFETATRFVAVSNSVRDTLAHEFAVPYDRVDLVHGFVPFPGLTPDEQRLRRKRVRNSLCWPDDAFVVGGCGSLGWRKGTDLFLQIANAVSRTNGYEKVRFLWVGGEAQGKEALEFTHDLRALGLQGRCCRVPNTTEVFDFYCAMDVFALTSREDPFPLVMLEAGAHGVPVVCFALSGGGPEFAGKDAGLTAPYLDNPAFAAHLMTLHDAPALRENLGAAARNKVRTQYSVEVQGPKILQSIRDCLSQRRGSALCDVR